MRKFFVAFLLGLVAHPPLAAQDTFELEVYPHATAHRGEWEAEGYLNYLSRGTKAFDGQVAPTDNQWRFAAQLTRGLTDRWEIAAYVLGAQVPGSGIQYAGWRARTRVSLPYGLGFAAELETSEPKFSESFRAAEFTPILERRIGRVQLLANPTLELRNSSGALLKANDDWKNSSPADKQAIIDSTIPPSNDLESAIVATLPGNDAAYTAIVRESVV
jgi:hypothetical protein